MYRSRIVMANHRQKTGFKRWLPTLGQAAITGGLIAGLTTFAIGVFTTMPTPPVSIPSRAAAPASSTAVEPPVLTATPGIPWTGLTPPLVLSEGLGAVPLTPPISEFLAELVAESVPVTAGNDTAVLNLAHSVCVQQGATREEIIEVLPTIQDVGIRAFIRISTEHCPTATTGGK